MRLFLPKKRTLPQLVAFLVCRPPKRYSPLCILLLENNHPCGQIHGENVCAPSDRTRTRPSPLSHPGLANGAIAKLDERWCLPTIRWGYSRLANHLICSWFKRHRRRVHEHARAWFVVSFSFLPLPWRCFWSGSWRWRSTTQQDTKHRNDLPNDCAAGSEPNDRKTATQ